MTRAEDEGPPAAVRLSGAELAGALAAWVASSDVPLMIADASADHPLVYVNPAFEVASGFPAARLVGRDVGAVLAAELHRDPPQSLREVLATDQPSRGRVLKHRADGSTWWSELHLSPIDDDDGRIRYIVGLQVDITDQVVAEQESVRAVTHDRLTGLVTHAHFIDSLDRELARAARDRTGLAVLFLDVDHLKVTNDVHGHAAGDALLVEIAARLRERLRGSDLAGRYGGDEFLVLLIGLPVAPAAAAAATARVVDELTRSLAEPIDVGPASLAVSVSIGSALHPRDGNTALELLSRADTAMYQEKRRGR